MTISRLHRHPDELKSFGRAKLNWPTLALLAVLRCYAIVGVATAVYAFFRAL